jgi:hypothetical protein
MVTLATAREKLSVTKGSKKRQTNADRL